MLLFAWCALLVGCVNQFDSVGLADDERRAYAVPLLSTSFTLGDALGTYDFVGTLEDRDGLRLVRLDTIFRRFPIRSIQLPQFTVPLFDTAITVNIEDIGLSLPVSRVEFRAGTLAYTLASNFAEPVVVRLQLDNFVRGGSPIVIERTLAPNERVSETYQLGGAAFVVGNPRVLRISYDARLPNGTRVRLLPGSLQLTSYEATQATGTLDSLVVPLGENNLTTPFLRDFVPNSASLRDARVRYNVISTVPTPLKLVARESYAALRDGTRFPFSTPIEDGFIVPASTGPGDTVRFSFEITPDNSELLDAVRQFPDSLVFNIDAIANPDGDPREFIIDENDIVIGFYTFDVPLDVSFDGFSVQEDFRFGASGEFTAEFSSATLVLSADNRIPVGASAQVYLLDDEGTVTDSFFVDRPQLLNPAAVNSSGEVVTSTRVTSELEVPDRLLSAVSSGTAARIRLFLETPDPDNLFVRLRSDQRLDLDLGLTFELAN